MTVRARAIERVETAMAERRKERLRRSQEIWGHPGAYVSDPPPLTISDLVDLVLDEVGYRKGTR